LLRYTRVRERIKMACICSGKPPALPYFSPHTPSTPIANQESQEEERKKKERKKERKPAFIKVTDDESRGI
jgi:hypothetical protein